MVIVQVVGQILQEHRGRAPAVLLSLLRHQDLFGVSPAKYSVLPSIEMRRRIEMLIHNRWPIPLMAVILEDLQLVVLQVVPSVVLLVIRSFPSGESNSIHHDGSRVREQSRRKDLWNIGRTWLTKVGLWAGSRSSSWRNIGGRHTAVSKRPVRRFSFMVVVLLQSVRCDSHQQTAPGPITRKLKACVFSLFCGHATCEIVHYEEVAVRK